VTVSLNGVDYDGPLDGTALLFTYYRSPKIAYLEPPGGPVLGGIVSIAIVSIAIVSIAWRPRARWHSKYSHSKHSHSEYSLEAPC